MGDGTDRLSWRDLSVIIRRSGQDSSLALQEQGEAALWSVSDHLLAGILDALHGANWQRSGSKGQRPKPVPRPGDKNAHKAAPEPQNTDPHPEDGDGGVFAKDGFEMDTVSVDEMNKWLGLDPLAV